MRSSDDAPHEWLLGRWRLQRAEPGLEILPGARMEFRRGGELVYTIALEGQVAAFTLAFRIEAGEIHTYHAGGGHHAVARLREQAGFLEFDFAGRRAWFVRERLI